MDRSGRQPRGSPPLTKKKKRAIPGLSAFIQARTTSVTAQFPFLTKGQIKQRIVTLWDQLSPRHQKQFQMTKKDFRGSGRAKNSTNRNAEVLFSSSMQDDDHFKQMLLRKDINQSLSTEMSFSEIRDLASSLNSQQIASSAVLQLSLHHKTDGAASDVYMRDGLTLPHLSKLSLVAADVRKHSGKPKKRKKLRHAVPEDWDSNISDATDGPELYEDYRETTTEESLGDTEGLESQNIESEYKKQRVIVLAREKYYDCYNFDEFDIRMKNESHENAEHLRRGRSVPVSDNDFPSPDKKNSDQLKEIMSRNGGSCKVITDLSSKKKICNMSALKSAVSNKNTKSHGDGNATPTFSSDNRQSTGVENFSRDCQVTHVTVNENNREGRYAVRKDNFKTYGQGKHRPATKLCEFKSAVNEKRSACQENILAGVNMQSSCNSPSKSLLFWNSFPQPLTCQLNAYDSSDDSNRDWEEQLASLHGKDQNVSVLSKDVVNFHDCSTKKQTKKKISEKIMKEKDFQIDVCASALPVCSQQMISSLLVVQAESSVHDKQMEKSIGMLPDKPMKEALDKSMNIKAMVSSTDKQVYKPLGKNVIDKPLNKALDNPIDDLDVIICDDAAVSQPQVTNALTTRNQSINKFNHCFRTHHNITDSHVTDLSNSSFLGSNVEIAPIGLLNAVPTRVSCEDITMLFCDDNNNDMMLLSGENDTAANLVKNQRSESVTDIAMCRNDITGSMCNVNNNNGVTSSGESVATSDYLSNPLLPDHCIPLPPTVPTDLLRDIGVDLSIVDDIDFDLDLPNITAVTTANGNSDAVLDNIDNDDLIFNDRDAELRIRDVYAKIAKTKRERESTAAVSVSATGTLSAASVNLASAVIKMPAISTSCSAAACTSPVTAACSASVRVPAASRVAAAATTVVWTRTAAAPSTAACASSTTSVAAVDEENEEMEVLTDEQLMRVIASSDNDFSIKEMEAALALANTSFGLDDPISDAAELKKTQLLGPYISDTTSKNKNKSCKYDSSNKVPQIDKELMLAESGSRTTLLNVVSEVNAESLRCLRSSSRLDYKSLSGYTSNIVRRSSISNRSESSRSDSCLSLIQKEAQAPVLCPSINNLNKTSTSLTIKEPQLSASCSSMNQGVCESMSVVTGEVDKTEGMLDLNHERETSFSFPDSYDDMDFGEVVKTASYGSKVGRNFDLDMSSYSPFVKLTLLADREDKKQKRFKILKRKSSQINGKKKSKIMTGEKYNSDKGHSNKTGRKIDSTNRKKRCENKTGSSRKGIAGRITIDKPLSMSLAAAKSMANDNKHIVLRISSIHDDRYPTVSIVSQDLWPIISSRHSLSKCKDEKAVKHERKRVNLRSKTGNKEATTQLFTVQEFDVCARTTSCAAQQLQACTAPGAPSCAKSEPPAGAKGPSFTAPRTPLCTVPRTSQKSPAHAKSPSCAASTRTPFHTVPRTPVQGMPMYPVRSASHTAHILQQSVVYPKIPLHGSPQSVSSFHARTPERTVQQFPFRTMTTSRTPSRAMPKTPPSTGQQSDDVVRFVERFLSPRSRRCCVVLTLPSQGKCRKNKNTDDSTPQPIHKRSPKVGVRIKRTGIGCSPRLNNGSRDDENVTIKRRRIKRRRINSSQKSSSECIQEDVVTVRRSRISSRQRSSNECNVKRSRISSLQRSSNECSKEDVMTVNKIRIRSPQGSNDTYGQKDFATIKRSGLSCPAHGRDSPRDLVSPDYICAKVNSSCDKLRKCTVHLEMTNNNSSDNNSSSSDNNRRHCNNDNSNNDNINNNNSSDNNGTLVYQSVHSVNRDSSVAVDLSDRALQICGVCPSDIGHVTLAAKPIQQLPATGCLPSATNLDNRDDPPISCRQTPSGHPPSLPEDNMTLSPINWTQESQLTEDGYDMYSQHSSASQKLAKNQLCCENVLTSGKVTGSGVNCIISQCGTVTLREPNMNIRQSGEARMCAENIAAMLRCEVNAASKKRRVVPLCEVNSARSKRAAAQLCQGKHCSERDGSGAVKRGEERKGCDKGLKNKKTAAVKDDGLCWYNNQFASDEESVDSPENVISSSQSLRNSQNSTNMESKVDAGLEWYDTAFMDSQHVKSSESQTVSPMTSEESQSEATDGGLEWYDSAFSDNRPMFVKSVNVSCYANDVMDEICC